MLAALQNHCQMSGSFERRGRNKEPPISCVLQSRWELAGPCAGAETGSEFIAGLSRERRKAGIIGDLG